MNKLIIIFVLLLGGCSHLIPAPPSQTVLVPEGAKVTTTLLKPSLYKAQNITVTFTDDGIVTTFVDKLTGNQVSATGNCTLDNVDYRYLPIKDFRKNRPIDNRENKVQPKPTADTSVAK